MDVCAGVVARRYMGVFAFSLHSKMSEHSFVCMMFHGVGVSHVVLEHYAVGTSLRVDLLFC